MALQVWLPLNKNFNNKGLDNNVTVNTTNLTIIEGGKLGHCVQVTSSKKIALSSMPYMAPSADNEMSIAMWVNAATFNYIIAFGAFELRIVANAAFFRTGDGSSPYTISAQYNSTFSTGTWYHICGTWSSREGRVRLYIDGNLVAENNNRPGNYKSPSSSMNLVYGGDWQISDFRIYDNEISPQDVKEIYWGKVFEITPQWTDKDRIMDASGFNFPLTPYNLTLENNKIKFNGSSSKIEFNGLKLTGGTISIWFTMPAKPTVQRVIYFDPVAKMVLGFLADGNLCVRTASGTRYQSTGITWGQMTHLVVGYNSSYVPQYCLVNGVQPATGSNTNWSFEGTRAAVGVRLAGGNNDWFNGTINEIKVFATMLTAAEAKTLYDKGAVENNWGEIPNIFNNVGFEYSGCTWLQVLHHNTPATKLFTSANGKNNDDPDLYSRLGLFDSNTNFRMSNGRYEFMVREKLESTHTESAATWVQTSSPTASTISGYQLLTSSPGNPPRTFGLCHQSANAVFDISTQDWWCACGCNTAYQGGIPGFWGVIKTGYLDLFIRIDNTKYIGLASVPSDYTPLLYIEGTGTQYIKTDITGFNSTDWEIFCEWKASAAPTGSYAYVFGAYVDENTNAYRLITNGTSNVNYYVSSNSKAGSSIAVNNLATANTHNILMKNKSAVVDGTTYSPTTEGTAIPSNKEMTLFSTTGSVFFKGRIYAFWAKKGGDYVANLVPAKRNSDNVVGMYDIIRRRFFTNAGSGSFIAGAVFNN